MEFQTANKAKLFFHYLYNIYHLKYMSPKFETTCIRGKIANYTSRQICAILPSKMAFELHSENTR